MKNAIFIDGLTIFQGLAAVVRQGWLVTRDSAHRFYRPGFEDKIDARRVSLWADPKANVLLEPATPAGRPRA